MDAKLKEVAERMRMLLSTLRPREEQILRMRFGIGQDHPLDDAEIALRLDLPESEVQAIASDAVATLRSRNPTTYLLGI